MFFNYILSINQIYQEIQLLYNHRHQTTHTKNNQFSLQQIPMIPQRIINSKNLYMLGLGYQPHFRFLKKQILKFKVENSFWLYDKTKLDIAFFLANLPRKVTKFTYITSDKFQTIGVNQKPESQKIQQEDKISDFLYNHNFKILNSFTDIHPYSAYVKICNYMNYIPPKDMKRIFRLSFSEHEIDLRGSFLPKMNEMRQNYLDTSGLKLRLLERKYIPTDEEVQKNIQAWKDHYQIDSITSTLIHSQTNQDRIAKQNWVVEHQFGWEVDKKYIFEGFGRKFSSIAYD